MTRIGNADQVLLLLQEQIARSAKKSGSARSAPAQLGTPDPVSRVRALAARAGLPEDELKRALVRGLLVQQLGDAVGNDPAFEAVAGDALRIITDTPEGQDLLDRALAQLSAPTAT